MWSFRLPGLEDSGFYSIYVYGLQEPVSGILFVLIRLVKGLVGQFIFEVGGKVSVEG